MFKQNKYTRWYFQIVLNAKTRDHKNLGYVEWHHIIPVSLGGDKGDKVALTPREHFICHLLLIKMLDGKQKSKMSWALHRMMYSNNQHQHRYIPSSRSYSSFRKYFYDQLRKPRNITEQHRQNIAASNKKNKQDFYESLRGRPRDITQDHKNNIIKANQQKRIPCELNGVVYPSFRALKQALGNGVNGGRNPNIKKLKP